jgi:biopolymer transport protein ExbB/TolQ
VQVIVTASLATDLEDVVYEVAKALFYPILFLAIACLVWVLIELGYFLYEAYLRFRYRDLEALEVRTLKARDAFERGQPRRAYRYLQENTYSVVVSRFLFDLIRNYQTQRLPEKPLKLLQEYEFLTIKRLERTRILVRVGPLLGLMGTLIPLAPALQALADGDTELLADNLTVAFSITVLGLLIGGIAFVISIMRDRFYSQDISDLEYLLELLEGNVEPLHIGKPRRRKGEFEQFDDDLADEEETVVIVPGAPDMSPDEAGGSTPGAGFAEGAAPAKPAPFVAPAPLLPGLYPGDGVGSVGSPQDSTGDRSSPEATYRDPEATYGEAESPLPDDPGPVVGADDARPPADAGPQAS